MSFEDDDFWSDLQDPDPAGDPISAALSKPSLPMSSASEVKSPKRGRKRHSVPEGQLDLLSDFWEEDAEADKEQALQDRFFKPLESEPKKRRSDEGVSRKVNVGLYRSDADLLEDIYKQSKRAGLKNVSRARILRVALRHFHTCWLNRADD